MKIKFLVLLIIIVSLKTHGRQIIETSLEPAIIEIIYQRRQVLDTLNCDNDFKKDLLTLKVGKSVSAFYSAALANPEAGGVTLLGCNPKKVLPVML